MQIPLVFRVFKCSIACPSRACLTRHGLMLMYRQEAPLSLLPVSCSDQGALADPGHGFHLAIGFAGL